MVSEELQDAVIRNLEVIGEAAKRVSAQTRLGLPSLDWKAICGMRDVLIHEVWNVVSSRIPELEAALTQFLHSDGAEPPFGSTTA